jgi:hypothetical protein
MPEKNFRIKWDQPDDENWCIPDNVSLALHSYCPNTHFAVFETKGLETTRNELDAFKQLYENMCVHLHSFKEEMEIKGRYGENIDDIVTDVAKTWKAQVDTLTEQLRHIKKWCEQSQAGLTNRGVAELCASSI